MEMNLNILKNDERVATELRALYHLHGYSRYKMSKFEEYALYVKNKDFLASEGIISFTDTRGKLLALKPDVTLSIINNSKDNPGRVEKLYYDENVYRISGTSHVYKEIRQTGLECIGDVQLLEILEVLSLALESLEEISSDFILDIAHVGLLDAVLDRFAFPKDTRNRIYTLLEEKNLDGFLKLAEEKNFQENVTETVKAFFGRYTLSEAEMLLLRTVPSEEEEKFREFREVLSFLKKLDAEKKIFVDFSLSQKGSYYSGVVFRGYIDGIPERVLSGGRYDKLMQNMGRTSGAIGFAVYLDTLERFQLEEKEYDADVLILAGKNPGKALSVAKKLTAEGKTVRISREEIPGLRVRSQIRVEDEL